MPQTLEFASVYVYSKGASEISVRSAALVGSLKRGDQFTISRCVDRTAALSRTNAFPKVFGDDVTLVPVPGSALLVKDGLWVPNILARLLRSAGLARDVMPLLRRVKAVAKSAFSAPAERPKVQTHIDSFAVDVLRPAPTKLLLVDDVVTQGSTLLAAAYRLRDVYPNAEIRAFALFRPMGKIDIERIIDPCLGTIAPRGDRAVRRP